MTACGNRFRTLALLLLQGGLGVLLIAAGVSKILSPAEFAEAIANYRLFPTRANQLLAVVLPWLEGATGLLLLFRLWSGAAAWTGALLFAAFSIAVGSALARRLDISCGCLGGSSGMSIGSQTLAFDLLAVAASILVARTADRAESYPGGGGGTLGRFSGAPASSTEEAS